MPERYFDQGFHSDYRFDSINRGSSGNGRERVGKTNLPQRRAVSLLVFFKSRVRLLLHNERGVGTPTATSMEPFPCDQTPFASRILPGHARARVH
jgi:hypothetical protein